MSNQKILEIIAAMPKCRKTEILENLSLPYEEVHAALVSLELVGDIVSKEGVGQTGMPCKVYNLSDKFKASDAYKLVAMKADVTKFSANLPSAGLTRADRAVAFIRERGEATTSELHAMLGLDPTEYVSTCLGYAVRDGRLVKQGKHWTLGPVEQAQEQQKPASNGELTIPVFIPGRGVGDTVQLGVPRDSRAFDLPSAVTTPVAAVEECDEGQDDAEGDSDPEPVASPASLRVMAALVSSVQAAAKATETQASEKAQEPRRTKPKSEPKGTEVTLNETTSTPAPIATSAASVPAISCGIWSDGTVEVRRDGQTTAVLLVAEMVCLADFWGRIQTSAKEAA